MSAPAVLIVTNERDVGADFLVKELGSRAVPVVRLNSERAPDWHLSLEPVGGWRIARGPRALRAEDCAGVWWRRPELPVAPASLAGEAVTEQWRVFLASLATVPGPIWVSDPARIRTAENKALQLRLASELGLLVPATVWTNDLATARDFVDSVGGEAIVKSLASAWWDAPDGARFVYASLVSRQGLPSAEQLALAPVVFQRPITPKRDLRVTVVGNTVHAAIRVAAGADGQEPIDWRQAPQCQWAPYELPANVSESCREMVRSLELRFAGIDFALDDRDQMWFLELNPNGEWGWLQRAGLPIAGALADTLTRAAAVA